MFRVSASILRSGFVLSTTPRLPSLLHQRCYAVEQQTADKSFKSLLDEITSSIKPRSDNVAGNDSVANSGLRVSFEDDNYGGSLEYARGNVGHSGTERGGHRGNGGFGADRGDRDSRGDYGRNRGNYGGNRGYGGSRGDFGGNRADYGDDRGSYGGDGGAGGNNGGGRGGYGSSRGNYESGGRGGYGGGSGSNGFRGNNNGYGGSNGGGYGRDSFGRTDPMNFGGKLQPVEWNKAELAPINKAIYTEHPDVKNMSQSQANEWRKQHSITIKGSGCPNPIASFSQTPFPPEIQKILAAKYTEPTPIQAQGWSLALSGKDMVGSSQTGSGKTLGFVLPALVHIIEQVKVQSHRWSDGPLAVVLAPTRELALQIIAESSPYTRALGLNTAAVFGGDPRGPQADKLRRGVHLLVATPGRLIDFLSDGTTSLRRVSYVVLDEADRMLDMGFEPQIRQIMSQLRPDRQTLMWSATWPYKVQALAHEFFNEPITIHVGSTDLRANPNVTQKIHITSEREKQRLATELVKELHKEGPVKTLIFCATKDMTEHMHYTLASQGFNSAAIHGGKTQAARMSMLGKFRDGHLQILVATDVAARGLDINNIQHVINYDFPTEIEDYVHRIGRTGRAGKTGISHTFLSHEKHPGKAVAELIKVLHDAGQEVTQELRSFSASMPRFSGRGPPRRSYSRW